MYPGPSDPDLGVFVANLERELLARGHEIERAVVDRRGGSRPPPRALPGRPARRPDGSGPEVAYAHFLVPAGLAAALATRAPLVVTAHGQDVANIGAIPGVRAATRHVVRRAASGRSPSRAGCASSLVAAVPEADGKTEVVDCGVDLERFAPRDADAARDELGWTGEGTHFLCLGGLTERKNVLRLARAFESRGEGMLVFVGGGPLRRAPSRDGDRNPPRGPRRPTKTCPTWIAASDVVCQPSLSEPFGLATLEAMASARSVVATDGRRAAGVRDARGGRARRSHATTTRSPRRSSEAAALPVPNLAGREAADAHDVKLQAERVEAILLRAARDRRA